MNEQRTALVVGATGLIGGHVVKLLLASPLYERVRVVARRKPALEDPKLDAVTVDFERLGEHAVEIAGDDVFCCLGTTIAKAGSQQAFARVDRDYPVEIARLARANGARQFLLISSVGADAKSANYYLRTKGDVEAAVSTLRYESVQILRPSLLLGERPEFRWKEKLSEPLARLFSVVMLGPLAKYRPIEGSAVASAMVAVAKQRAPGIHIIEGRSLRKPTNDA